MIEIHGLRKCPFAWRSRLVAREKAVAFDWIPYDVADPDPRAAAHNPDHRSPRLVHGDFTLVESSVIDQYLDEAFPGRSLQPADARARAEQRLAIVELSRLEAGDHRPFGAEQFKKVDDAYQALEQRLADGRAWLGGGDPSLADLHIWPFLTLLLRRGMGLPPRLARASAYWDRLQQRPSFLDTRPR